jgi:hypothetical protein
MVQLYITNYGICQA